MNEAKSPSRNTHWSPGLGLDLFSVDGIFVSVDGIFVWSLELNFL
ncbi:MAG: hypothetical protein ACRCVX_04985 [Shewanella sp.]